jgi:hypothetical protein
MLDPRIYRMGLVPVVLAVIVLAFSLGNQPGPLTTSLAPDAYSGQNAYAAMNSLASRFPDRAPGSAGDRGLASFLANQLGPHGYQFSVSTTSFRGTTPRGPRTLENVIATRAGQQNGSIVVVAQRDALGSPATTQLSGTAVLMELARVLSGETLQHTIVLASTSGTAGGAGAAGLVRALPRPIDAVIVLGDLAATNIRQPIVVPWSNGQQVAPLVLRNTVGATLAGQAGQPPSGTSLLGQLAHLVLPMAPSGQAPFDQAGDPAVLLSLSGEQQSGARAQPCLADISATGRAALQAVNALDGDPRIPAPSSYLIFSGKTVPAWAVRLLGLALILPVLFAAIDGMARARRRGHPILRWVAWVVAGAVPFVLSALIVRFAEAIGAISGATAVPLAGGVISLHAGELAFLAALACLIVVGVPALRWLVARRLGLSRFKVSGSYGEGAAAGVLIVLCVVALAIWLANPFAALLLFPALHLWLWVVVPDVKVPRPAVALLLVCGLALPVLVAAQYAISLGLGPLQAAWSWVLLVGGGSFGLSGAIEWSLYLGCAISVIAIAGRSVRQPQSEPAPVTVRGPVTYAGPGSLGGTKSALRR